MKKKYKDSTIKYRERKYVLHLEKFRNKKILNKIKPTSINIHTPIYMSFLIYFNLEDRNALKISGNFQKC